MGSYELRYKITKTYTDYLEMMLVNADRPNLELMLRTHLSYVKMAAKRPPDAETSEKWYFSKISWVLEGKLYEYDSVSMQYSIKYGLKWFKMYGDRPFANISPDTWEDTLNWWVDMTVMCELCYEEMELYEG